MATHYTYIPLGDAPDAHSRAHQMTQKTRSNMCGLLSKALRKIEGIDIAAEAECSAEQSYALNLRAEPFFLDDVTFAEVLKHFETLWRTAIPGNRLANANSIDDLVHLLLAESRFEERCLAVAQNNIEQMERAAVWKTRLRPNDAADGEGGRTFISVLTYNVDSYGVAGRRTPQQQISETAAGRGVLDAILRSKADVVVLQEVHEGWIEYFRSRGLESVYVHRAFHALDMGPGGLALYSKLPLLEKPVLLPVHKVVKGSVFPAAKYVLEAYDGVPVTVINTHLRPPVSMDRTIPTGPFSMLETSAIRRAELLAILCMALSLPVQPQDAAQNEEKVVELALRVLSGKGAGGRFIFAGDMNENDGHSAHSLLTRDLQLFDALSLDFSLLTHYWTLQGSLFTVHKRLDHMLVTPALLLPHSVMVDETAKGHSDHMPVIAVIEVLR